MLASAESRHYSRAMASRVLGLTGGIGSGKSTVARLLAARGAHIIDADALAREAVAPGSAGLEAIRARFGTSVFAPDGTLDRQALGAQVFGDPERRQALNAIVHPEVARLAMQKIQALRAAAAPLIVYDVPLLYENNLDRMMLPEVIVVDAPREARRARLRLRDGLSDEAIEARIAAQMPLGEKVRRARWVIDNGGTLEATTAAVDALWAQLTARPDLV